MKIYFRHQRKYYDGDTGEIVYSYTAGKGYVVEVTDRTTYREKKGKFGAKFLYRKRDGTYIGSSSLTTAFLYEVAKDRYRTDRIVMSSPACMVCFIGGRQEFYRFSDEEEKAKHLEAFFQGMDFTEVKVGSLVATVLPSRTKRLVAVGLPVAGVLLFLIALGRGGEEEILQPAPVIEPVQVESKPSYEELVKAKIRKTRAFLTEFFRLAGAYASRDVFFVSSVDFNSGIFKVGAMVPAEGFRWNGRYFEKAIAVDTRKSVTGLREKDVKECRKSIYEAGAQIGEAGERQEKYILSGVMDAEKLYRLLKSIYFCPVHVEGVIGYRNLLEREVNLDIWLYKLQGGEGDGGAVS